MNITELEFNLSPNANVIAPFPLWLEALREVLQVAVYLLQLEQACHSAPKVQDVNNQERLGRVCMVEPCQSNRTAKTSRIQFGYWGRMGALVGLEAQWVLHDSGLHHSGQGFYIIPRKDLCHDHRRPEASTSWL